MIYASSVDRIPKATSALWTLLSHLQTPLGAEKAHLFFLMHYQDTDIHSLGSIPLWSFLLSLKYHLNTILVMHFLLVLYLKLIFHNQAIYPLHWEFPKLNWNYHCPGHFLGKKSREVPLSYLMCRAQTQCPEFTMNIHAVRVPWKNIFFLKSNKITKIFLKL